MSALPTQAQQLIDQLGLLAHPEGGYFKEMYRSEITLEGQERQLLTSIYFLLVGEEVSHFHRIKSDECWYFHAGNGLTVHTLDSNESSGHKQFLLGSDFTKGELPFYVVKANTIFGSSITSKEGYALVSCAVAPGFDFRDFELFSRADLSKIYPAHDAIIAKLTMN